MEKSYTFKWILLITFIVFSIDLYFSESLISSPNNIYAAIVLNIFSINIMFDIIIQRQDEKLAELRDMFTIEKEEEMLLNIKDMVEKRLEQLQIEKQNKTKE